MHSHIPPSTHVQNISIVVIHDVDDIAVWCPNEESP
jgi:hypothetical protein